MGDWGGSPTIPGISDTRGWGAELIQQKYESVRDRLDWASTVGSARKWWIAFEDENKPRMPLVLRLAEELLLRNATITEFFLAYVYSNTDNIQANLHYLDYTRLKKKEESEKKLKQRKELFASLSELYDSTGKFRQLQSHERLLLQGQKPDDWDPKKLQDWEKFCNELADQSKNEPPTDDNRLGTNTW